MPSKKEITNFVLVALGHWATRRVATMKFETTLTDDLNLSALDLRTLTGALRSYVQRSDESKTVILPEVKKSKAIGPLVSLIISKLYSIPPESQQVKSLIRSVKEDY